jgi:hypothetical protein
MSLPKYLHAGMTGAPTLTLTNGSMNALLLACLVNGFNTKAPTSASSNGSVVSLVYATDPGFLVGTTITISGASNALYNGEFRVVTTGTTVTVANTVAPSGSVAGTLSTKYAPLGWTRPYSGTNIGCYRQGGTSATKRLWRIRDHLMGTDGGFFVRGYEDMTAVSTGTGPFPTVAQATGDGAQCWGPSAAVDPHAWVIVGTPRFVYLFVAHTNTDTGNLGVLPTNIVYGLAVGEFADTIPSDSYAHMCPAGPYAMMQEFYLPRAHTGVGTSVIGVAHGIGAPGTGFGAAAPDPAGNIRFGPAPLVYDTVIRGFFPGALCTYHKAIDDGALIPGQILTNVAGVTGRVVVVRNSYYGSGRDEYGLLLDEDWGDV